MVCHLNYLNDFDFQFQMYSLFIFTQFLRNFQSRKDYLELNLN